MLRQRPRFLDSPRPRRYGWAVCGLMHLKHASTLRLVLTDIQFLIPLAVLLLGVGLLCLLN